MPTKRNPHKGSMQYWPRKRASRMYPRLSHYPAAESSKLAGFAGYKVGMTHVFVADNRSNSMTKGQSIFFPVTIIECPPLKVASIRFYKSLPEGMQVAKEIFATTDKQLAKKITLPKKEGTFDGIDLSQFSDIRLNVYTQPKIAGINKKRPEIFEMAIGGKTVEEKFNYAKSIIGKEIAVSDVLKEGQQVDIFAVSKGKGFQGPVKRFGVALRQKKSEKVKRGPANVGSWTGNRSWTVAHAGQMGFHNRLDKNKLVLKIGDKPEEVNAAGGFIGYGLVKSNYLLLKGSLPGTVKRLVRITNAATPNHRLKDKAPVIESVSLTSKQR